MGKIHNYNNSSETSFPVNELFEGEDRCLRAERLYVSFPVTAIHRGNPIQGYVEAINISWSGMLLATNFPVDQNDILTLDFCLPDTVVPISTQARVVRTLNGQKPEHATILGVVFVDLDPNMRRLINGYILERLSTY